MKGSECKFVKYMEGSDKRFVIPVYQRNYDWKIENCKQLYDDLVKIIKNGRNSHFFGSLVSVYNPDGHNEEFLVIDGQQRLTTISLLFLAMYNLLNNETIVAISSNLKQRIFEEYLVDKWQPEETRIKLKPVKNDQKAFDKLFDNEDEFIRDSNLTTNYNYFYERIQKQEITIDQLFSAICSLEIINITLNNDDNPQLIFESLNSTGLDLSEGDKIRNFILMGLPSRIQDEYYDKYWNRIEEYTQYDVSSFIRDYLSVKQLSIPSQKRIYKIFKEFVEQKEILMEELLKDLLSYAKRYGILLKGNTNSRALNASIYRLNRLETTVTRPFFLEVLRLLDNNKIDMAQVTDIFLTTENYLFRRNICEIPTNALNKIFLLLHREIIRYDGTDDNYIEKFKYALLSKKEKARFPVDSEFISNFSHRQVYQMNSKNKIYIFERFENSGTLEDKDVYAHCDDGTYSIEHIMPQHLTPSWCNALGENYKEIHETWLHRLANLTLTAYNSKYSNSSFEEKRTMKNGFVDSGIRMNTYIAKQSKWTETELVERDQQLMERAIEIWTYPTTSYSPKVKQLDTYTLEDDASLSGRQIARFSYRGIEYPANSWAEMFQKVLQLLYNEDKSIIAKLASSTEDPVSNHFDYNSSRFINSVEIGDGIYVLTNTSTQIKLFVLNRVFKLYNAELSDLLFFLHDETENEEVVARYERRRRYWTLALDYIKQVHGADGLFQDISPTKDYYINDYFHISGVCISCVSNNNLARVELYLGKSQKTENKRVSDNLLKHKDEIEESLGVSLVWDRGEDTISSKIYLRLDGVSIENESDWLMMAKFQAEWSKKFYDIIVPYLRNELR